MFDGSELSAVYGDMYSPAMNNQPSMDNNQQSLQQPLQQPLQQKQAQVPPNVEYAVPEPVYQQQSPSPSPPKVVYQKEESFWERMSSKKGEVYKLFMFALVILLGIAIHKFLFHYLTAYLEENMMNPTNEFLIRLAYPVSVLIVLWILRSM